MGKNTAKAEYGDFQTPAALAQRICALLAQRGLHPGSLVEPTCGLGAFLLAGLKEFSPQKAIGADINDNYVKWVRGCLDGSQRGDAVTLTTADFFRTDWQDVIHGLPEPVLVLGNPPWVTNAALTTLGSQNLPAKSNFQNHNGIDAITGKANFDICEWMLIQLIEALNGRNGTLAMLCKSSVARKSLLHAWKCDLSLSDAAIYDVDADLHFDASVDAVLLVMEFGPRATGREAPVYSGLTAVAPQSVIGFENGTLLADVQGYHRWEHLRGTSTLRWRSGIKHDCSKVMELRREVHKYRNGHGELIELEDAYLYPLLKSSDVANERYSEGCRWLIVTQRGVGENTAEIEQLAPKTWRYLTSHADHLAKRGSSIYRNRPPFSIFGVGDYSFAPWKVAISGFYKRLAFGVVGPIEGKPTMLDDTSYFLPCETQEQAEYLVSLLNSTVARSFYSAFVFWDAKRPITIELLRHLDLRLLARELGSEGTFVRHFGAESLLTAVKTRKGVNATLALFPD